MGADDETVNRLRIGPWVPNHGVDGPADDGPVVVPAIRSDADAATVVMNAVGEPDPAGSGGARTAPAARSSGPAPERDPRAGSGSGADPGAGVGVPSRWRWADQVLTRAGAVPAAGGAGRPGAPRAPWRRGVVVGALVAVIGLAVAVPLALASLVPRYAAQPPSDETAGGIPVAATSDAAATTSASPTVAGAGSAASRSAPSRRPSSGSPSASASRTTPFPPASYEAETQGNTIGGSGWVTGYPGASGGRIVRNLGRWGSSKGDGWLRFNQVTVPEDGSYTVTVYVTHLDGTSARTMHITVVGGASASATVTAGTACCAAGTARIGLKRGANSITFGNPKDHAPSIDRIVLSRP
jgi:hypothetical protein